VSGSYRTVRGAWMPLSDFALAKSQDADEGEVIGCVRRSARSCQDAESLHGLMLRVCPEKIVPVLAPLSGWESRLLALGLL